VETTWRDTDTSLSLHIANGGVTSSRPAQHPPTTGIADMQFVTIEANTTAQTLAWTVPKLAEYPRDTEL
jgi:hypothetical protein